MNLNVCSKFFVAFVIFSVSGALELYSQGGGAAVPFLRISPDARASGMGEVGTAIADNINAVYWNPGGLGFLQDFNEDALDPNADFVPYRQISLAFSPWLPQFNADLFYSYGTVGMYFDKIDGMVAFNFIFMNLGEFKRTTDNGTELGKFLSNEYSFGLSYGTIVAEDFGVGFQLRFIRSNLAPLNDASSKGAGVGISGSFDLGLLWKPQDLKVADIDLSGLFSIGVNLQNVGPKLTYRSESDPLPTTLRGGIAIYPVKDEYNDIKIAFDISKLLVKRDKYSSDPLPKSLITGWENPGAEIAFGAEYWYAKTIAIRGGYFVEPAILGDRNYWNFGAGVSYNIFKLDFSFINTIEANHPLANTMRFSLLIDLK